MTITTSLYIIYHISGCPRVSTPPHNNRFLRLFGDEKFYSKMSKL